MKSVILAFVLLGAAWDVSAKSNPEVDQYARDMTLVHNWARQCYLSKGDCKPAFENGRQAAIFMKVTGSKNAIAHIIWKDAMEKSGQALKEGTDAGCDFGRSMMNLLAMLEEGTNGQAYVAISNTVAANCK